MHIDLVVILMMLKGVPASNGVRPANWFESSGGTRAPSRVQEACAGAPAPPGAFRDSHDYRVLTVIVGFLRGYDGHPLVAARSASHIPGDQCRKCLERGHQL